MRSAILIVAALVLAGCAAPAGPTAAQMQHWSKPGSNQQQFMADRYDCLRQAQQTRAAVVGNMAANNVVESHGMFMSCLTAHGYVLDPNGNLAAPAEAALRNWVD
jgi:hypothetical protein